MCEREFLFLAKVATNRAFEMMGLHDALDSAVFVRLISYLTEPSRELERKVREGTKKQFQDSLEGRSSASVRDVDDEGEQL